MSQSRHHCDCPLSSASNAASDKVLAQIFNLLYRRFATCYPPACSGTLPITNRRYSRFPICATTAGTYLDFVTTLGASKLLFLWILMLGTWSLSPLRAATISGTVRAEGKPTASSDSPGGKYDSRQFKFVERIDYTELHDFVVYIDGPVGTNAISPPSTTMQIDTRKSVSQKGAIFSPHVLPVLVGTTVEWPNHDDILHNVFSFSEAASFDLGLYKQPEVKKVQFKRPGRVDVFCSIHARMNCIVLVLENPFFAAANDRGFYKIADVPPGTYKLKAWHERLPPQAKEITVPQTGDLKVDFVLGIKNLPNL